MSITLEIDPKVEESLQRRARSSGLSLGEFLNNLLSREAGVVSDAIDDGKSLSGVFEPLRGIVPDEWLDFERDRSSAKVITFE